MGYLADTEVDALIDAIIALTGDYTVARPGLLAPLPGGFRMLFPNSPVPRVQLRLDLTKLNRTVRLADGRVPLVAVLRTLLSDFGAADGEAAAVVNRILSEVARVSSGAPAITQPTPSEIKEAVIHQNDMLPAAFLRLGVQAGAAVARLTVPRFENGVQSTLPNHDPVQFLGTGWLMGEKLLITNHHVVNARVEGEDAASREDLVAQVLGATIQFDYDDAGGPRSVKAAPLNLITANAILDYALIEVDSGERRPLKLSPSVPQSPPGHGAAAVNIVQHPDGSPKKFAIRNNLIASVTDRDLRYFTDTAEGSSGSPVFNDDWNVVALHRGSTAVAQLFQGRATAQVNLGTRVSAILADLEQSGIRSQLGL
ncbi:MAG: serine protease [Bradyrhizobium sp.]|nr:serine protease [Bradyrhizobium sp.]